MRHVLTAIHTKTGVLLALVFTWPDRAGAESELEGQTGVFVTPLPTPRLAANNVGKPIVATTSWTPVRCWAISTRRRSQRACSAGSNWATRVFHGDGTPASAL